MSAPSLCSALAIADSRTLFLRLLVRNVSLEGTRYGELAQFVANHVFSHKHRYMLPAVVHRNRQTNEVGQHGGTTRPGLDRALVIGTANGFNLLQQMPVNEGAFFN